jgi:hypothetical protein
VCRGFGTAGGETGSNAGSRFRWIGLSRRRATSRQRYLFDDVPVSRRHAECRWENDELHVVDMGSLNDTYVNRAKFTSASFAWFCEVSAAPTAKSSEALACRQ